MDEKEIVEIFESYWIHTPSSYRSGSRKQFVLEAFKLGIKKCREVELTKLEVENKNLITAIKILREIQ